MNEVQSRNEAEDALGKGMDFFRSPVQNASDVKGVLAADGTLLYVGPAVDGMLGYAPEEVVGTSVFDYVHPDEAERTRGALADTLMTAGALPLIEFRARCADGTWRRVEVARNYLLNDPDRPGVVIDVRDASERKEEAEEALRATGTFLRGLLRNLPNGSVDVFDGDLRYLFAEGRGPGEDGLSSEMLVGRSVGGVFGEEGLGLAEDHYPA